MSRHSNRTQSRAERHKINPSSSARASSRVPLSDVPGRGHDDVCHAEEGLTFSCPAVEIPPRMLALNTIHDSFAPAWSMCDQAHMVTQDASTAALHARRAHGSICRLLLPVSCLRSASSCLRHLPIANLEILRADPLPCGTASSLASA